MNKCAGTVRCRYIFKINRSTKPKWQFLGCVTIAFTERHVRKSPPLRQSSPHTPNLFIQDPLQ